jgi:hypothetical protein
MFVTFERATAVFGSVDIQDILTMTTLGTDSELRAGCTSEWFEVVGGVAPLVGYDLVELLGDSVLCVLVEIVIGSLCWGAELPTPLVVTHRRQRCPRG